MRAVAFIKELVHQVVSHDIDDAAAMLAYYAVLAMFPMLIFVVALVVSIFPASALLEGFDLATRTVPHAIRELLREQIVKLSDSEASGIVAIAGAAVALWGASRAAVAAMRAMARITGERDTRSWIRRQLVAIAVTLGVAVLVVAAIAVLVVGPIAGHWVADRFALGDAFDLGWSIGRWIGAGLLVLLVWAIAYRVLPPAPQPFRLFTPGAVIGVALWLAISWLFQLYVSTLGAYAVTYGAAGTVVILLTWIWLTNMAFLLGAEINAVAAHRFDHGTTRTTPIMPNRKCTEQ